MQYTIINVMKIGCGGITTVIVRYDGVGNLRVRNMEPEIPLVRIARLIVATGRIDGAVAGDLKMTHVDNRSAHR